MARKVYVGVTSFTDAEGTVSPRSILYEDGESYVVDRVLDVRPRASLKAGGAGLRYTCRIGRAEAHLFYEDGRWFVEARR